MRLRRGTRVLDRGDGALQIGIRPALVLRGLTDTQRRFLERLETSATVTPLQQQRHRDLIDALAAADVLEPPPPPSLTLAVSDAGPIGLSVGRSAARDGWAVRFIDDGRIEHAPPGTYSTGVIASSRQGAACATVRSQMPQARVSVGDGPADVWVVVSHGAPALEVALPLMTADVPHLFVCVDERGSRVGPFVEPGIGACGWCDGLARADEDPAWPRIALQLGAPHPATPTASADVIAGATALVLGALGAWRSGDAELWRNSAHVLTTGQPNARRTLAPHPRCGCGAAGPVGDDLAARRARFQQSEPGQQ